MPISLKMKKYRNYRKLGYSGYASARLSGYAVSKARGIRADEDEVKELLEMSGLTVKDLALKLKSGCEADDLVIDRNGTEHTKPNWTARQTFLKMVLEMRGDLNNKSANAPSDGGVKGLIIIRADAPALKPQKVDLIDIEAQESKEPDRNPEREKMPLTITRSEE